MNLLRKISPLIKESTLMIFLYLSAKIPLFWGVRERCSCLLLACRTAPLMNQFSRSGRHRLARMLCSESARPNLHSKLAGLPSNVAAFVYLKDVSSSDQGVGKIVTQSLTASAHRTIFQGNPHRNEASNPSTPDDQERSGQHLERI